MRMRAPNWWRRCALWTTWCCLTSRTSSRCWNCCGRTFTRRAPTIRKIPCPSAKSPRDWESAWRLWATRRSIRRANLSRQCARLRMPDPRFLVVRLGSLGDIVHTFPAVAALRDSFPTAEIVWLTHPRWRGLVASSGLASEIRNVESRDFGSVRAAISGIRALEWQSAIDYQGLWKSAALPFLGGVRRRIGFSPETIREFGVPILYNQRVKPETIHIADQNGELSRRAGARRRVGHVKLTVSSQSMARARDQLSKAGISDRYVVLSPGGGWRAKCWPPERFGGLCQKIRDEFGFRCVVNYGPGENDLAVSVKAASGDSDPLLWDTELGPLMALLRSAVCIVGGDTGPFTWQLRWE